MVNKLIELSLRNRIIVIIIAMGLLGLGIYNIQRNPVDAIPDLSENQVIVFYRVDGAEPTDHGRPGYLSFGE
jgi:Cu(I)/Ag(I) efflux system membrane protein CusA/SilA